MKADHISFKDYEADTRELAELGAAAVEAMRRERDEALMLFWAAVRLAGGSVSIPRRYLMRGVPEKTERSDDIVNAAIEFRIR